MGDRGPAPRREAEVRRTNNKGLALKVSREDLQNLPFEIDLEPAPPEVGEDWPPVLRELWEALQVDPCRQWMTAGDWAATKFVLEVTAKGMTQASKDGDVVGLNGSQQTAILKHLSNIGITEDARLRLRKEITLFPAGKGKAKLASVSEIENARRNEVE